jgi:MerR family transcriptional regulator, redox-sensitive transcriptional activator SoxR
VSEKKSRSKVQGELTVGEVAARLGLAVSAIQFYESKGLIAGVRTAGRRRRYTSDVLQRIAVIRTAQGVGIPLSAVRDILAALPTERRPSREDWQVALGRWLTEVDARTLRLEELITQLIRCEKCGCLLAEKCPLLAN